MSYGKYCYRCNKDFDEPGPCPVCERNDNVYVWTSPPARVPGEYKFFALIFMGGFIAMFVVALAKIMERIIYG
jgi:hypothetical protein